MINIEELVKSELRTMGLYKTDKYFEKECYQNGSYVKITPPFIKIRDEIIPTIDMSDFSYKSNLTEKDFTWEYDEYWTDVDDNMHCSYRLPTKREKQEIVESENRRREEAMYVNKYNHRLAKAIAISIAKDIEAAEKEFKRKLEEWKRLNFDEDENDKDNEDDEDDIF